MEILPSSSFFWTALVIAAIAAVSDSRSGRIPNWLTLPALVLAPIGYGVTLGWDAALWSIGAALLCALIPYAMFRHGSMGGGDVKLFAALGALTSVDPGLGIEIELCSFVLASLLSLLGLAWKGRLLSTLRQALFVLLSPCLARSRRAELSAELMTPVRMGVSIFAATVLCALPQLLYATGPTP